MAVLNGRLPGALLATIPGTNKQLRSDLVPQTTALRTAFEKRFGKPLVITDAYRTYEEQVRLKATKGVYAATPGTSNHGLGQAIDFGSGVNVEGSAEYLWMRESAPRFGWTHPLWARDGNPRNGQQEPWHWEAVLVPVSNYQTVGGHVPTAPNVTAPTPINPEDELDANQNAYLIGAHDNAAESRRLSGEVLAVLKTISTQLGEMTVLLKATHENASEARRIGGVLAGAVKPSGLEKTIAQQTKGA